MMRTHRTRRTALAAVAATTLSCALVVAPLPATAAIVDEPIVHSVAEPALTLTPIGTFETGVFDESAAEIVQAHGNRLFVVNAQAGALDVLDYSDPSNIVKEFSITSEGIANSVAIRADGLGVIAFEAPVKTDPGHLVFFDAKAADAASARLGEVTAGALPDMVAISPDGAYAVVANEGEPDTDTYFPDPEGSISVVSLPSGVAAPAQSDVRTADFHEFEAGGSKTLPADVRVFGPVEEGNLFPVSTNLEPEYVTIDGGTAYAALQEANAVAVIDLATATVTDIWPLGFKDHGAPGNGLDASDRDPNGAPTFNIRTFEGLKGIYMPDGIASYQADGQTYLVTANEGDAREWAEDHANEYIEAIRVKDLGKKGVPAVCADSPLAGMTGDADLGRLNVSLASGLSEAGDCYQELYAFGARSFSIWATDGTQVFDSGDEFERITHAANPDYFNSNHSESNLEGRSDDKGPEPENLAIGVIDGRSYAFIGFERVGGVAVYDITTPAASEFVTYINNRDFSISMEDSDDEAADLPKAGDLGAEGLAFIPAADSVTGEPLLAVANEVSGTVTLYAIDTADSGSAQIQILTVNDFHGRVEANFGNGEAGAAVLAGAVAELRAENPHTLFVSAGDNIGASTFTSFIADDNPTIDALRAAGLDLGAVGNHEFDQGYADLTDRVLPRFGDEGFGLGANVVFKDSDAPALTPYVIEEVDGVTVAFIGVVTPDTAAMVTPTGIADIAFTDMLIAANTVAAEIADEVDVTILLAHDGHAGTDCSTLTDGSSSFSALVSGASDDIDAIVSGHTHQAYTCVVDGMPVIQAHQYGTTLGKLDIEVDRETGELLSIEPSLVPLVEGGTPAFPADAAVAAIVADAVAEANVLGAVSVGAIGADILRGKTPTGAEDRGVESTLGNLVADVYLWATSNPDYAGTPAQIGIMNPGGLRADLLHGTAGAMTVRDVANVQPFANTLVTLTLTGAQLGQVLEEQWQPTTASRPYLHLGVSDGFEYLYDPEAPRGERIVSMSLHGEPIGAADTFTVVTNSFLAAGGDNFTTFAEGTDRTDTGQVDLAATVDYFATHPLVEPAPFGRAADARNLEWAEPTGGAPDVAPGESFEVTASGLAEGQLVVATLYSDPIVITGIPRAGADGTVTFTVAVPADITPGAHTLVVGSPGMAIQQIDVTVTAASGGSGGSDDDLAATGAETPWGLALGAALLVVIGALALVTRRRTAITA